MFLKQLVRDANTASDQHALEAFSIILNLCTDSMKRDNAHANKVLIDQSIMHEKTDAHFLMGQLFVIICFCLCCKTGLIF